MAKSSSMTSRRIDIYAQVTSRIVAELEAGLRPWIQPWTASHAAGEVSRPLRFNGIPYRGINIVLLWLSALRRHYASPLWMTYKQAAELGGHVRRGETGSLVVYADRFTRREVNENGEEEESEIPFLKSYTVFNTEQIDGLPAQYYATPAADVRAADRIERAEQFFAQSKADIRHGGGLPYYVQSADFIQMPAWEAFKDADNYYATLAHELTHWTGHRARLDREFGRERFGDESYAMEELVAEMGAAFLCADLGVTLGPRHDHAAYIASWLKVLRNDKRAVFTAASHAQRAADFLHNLQPTPAEAAA
jgi:antirestriction protein ArdC